MFIQRRATYTAPPAALPPRRHLNYRTSSAFSSSANPDEDWTKISDPTKRKKVQSRIAQRIYRKKLKKRREELERQARASNNAPSSGNEKPSPPVTTKHTPAPKAPRQTPPSQVKPVMQSQYSPPTYRDDEYIFPQPYDKLERSYTPPMFAYAAYPPPPEEIMMPIYGAVSTYPPRPTDLYLEWLSAPPVSAMLPSMTHFGDAIREEPTYPGVVAEESMGPYMSYNGYPLPGINLSAGHHSLNNEMAPSLLSPCGPFSFPDTFYPASVTSSESPALASSEESNRLQPHSIVTEQDIHPGSFQEDKFVERSCSPSQGPQSAVTLATNTPVDTAMGESAQAGITYSVYGGTQSASQTRELTATPLSPAHKSEGHGQTHRLTTVRRPGTPTGMTPSALPSTKAGLYRCDSINPRNGEPCNTVFTRIYDLTRHQGTIHDPNRQKVRCSLCSHKTFSRADALAQHYRVCHPGAEFPGKQRGRSVHS